MDTEWSAIVSLIKINAEKAIDAIRDSDVGPLATRQIHCSPVNQRMVYLAVVCTRHLIGRVYSNLEKIDIPSGIDCFRL